MTTMNLWRRMATASATATLLLPLAAHAHPGHGVPEGQTVFEAFLHQLSMGHAGPVVLVTLLAVLGLRGAGLGLGALLRRWRASTRRPHQG